MTFLSSMRKERPTNQAPPIPPMPPVPSVPEVPQVPAAPVAEFRAEPAAPAAAEAPVPWPAAESPAAPPAAVPPPAPAASAPVLSSDLRSYPRATFLDRLVAFVLDVILVAIVNGWLTSGYFFFGRGPDNPYVAMLFLYHVAFWAWKGTTLGGIICNIRMVRTTGEEPRFIDALVRALSAIFSVAALFIGCLWMLTDPEKQMWHDKFAGTYVVKVPRALVVR
jgi:uncharacterized RDD family membrane protein YckC